MRTEHHDTVDTALRYAADGARVLVIALTRPRATDILLANATMHVVKPGLLEHVRDGRIYVTTQWGLISNIRGCTFDRCICESDVTLTPEQAKLVDECLLGQTGLSASESKAAVEEELRWAIQLKVMRGEIDPAAIEKAQDVIKGLAEHLTTKSDETADLTRRLMANTRMTRDEARALLYSLDPLMRVDDGVDGVKLETSFASLRGPLKPL